MKHGKWDTMKECVKFDNTCGNKSFNTNVNGAQDTTTRYTCSEGICFEDSQGIYTTLEECVTTCELLTVLYEPPEAPDLIEDLKPVDRGDIVECKKGYYWCDTLQLCIPNKTECPVKKKTK